MAYQGGLRAWFKADWVDVKTGKPCGRSKPRKGDKKRPYPACRPKAVASKMSAAEKDAMARKKRGRKRVNWTTTASGKRRKKK